MSVAANAGGKMPVWAAKAARCVPAARPKCFGQPRTGVVNALIEADFLWCPLACAGLDRFIVAPPHVAGLTLSGRVNCGN